MKKRIQSSKKKLHKPKNDKVSNRKNNLVELDFDGYNLKINNCAESRSYLFSVIEVIEC